MDSFTLVIFGITSNLAQIKLIPTLYDLVASGQLPQDYQIIGIGRTIMDESQFGEFVNKTLHAPNRHHTHPIDQYIVSQLLSHLTYLSGDVTNSDTYTQLSQILKQSPGNRLFYLATFPALYATIFSSLKDAHLITQTKSHWVRLLIEKPIGTDRDSAQELNKLLTTHFSENQLFRLDHYLGKETLQNILTFRFGNGLLEPLMSAEHIDHIQVTATEDFGIGGRGSYYDQNGAIKDVGQNHILQMIALATMDAPSSYSTADIMTKRIEAIQSLVPLPDTLVTGQYQGYTTEPNVSPLSAKETYFAFKTHLTKTKFAGVPIYVRGGKMLTRTATEISIIFKNNQSRILSHLGSGMEPNVLIFRIQPNEGIVLKILTKVPGHELQLVESYMQYCYPQTTNLPDAYERLLLDAVKGDQTFFNDSAEIDAQWSFADSLIGSINHSPIIYKPGSWGPPAADELLARDGRTWLEPSTAFCPR